MTRSISTDRYRVFTECLIDARKKAEMTQQEVANRLERPQSFVAKYERGERRLDVIEFLEVCEVLGWRPERIIRKLVNN